jgi:hypothetical protein
MRRSRVRFTSWALSQRRVDLSPSCVEEVVRAAGSRVGGWLLLAVFAVVPAACTSSAPPVKSTTTDRSDAAPVRLPYNETGLAVPGTAPVWVGPGYGNAVPSSIDKSGRWSEPFTLGSNHVRNLSESPVDLIGVKPVKTHGDLEVVDVGGLPIAGLNNPPSIGVENTFPVPAFEAAPKLGAVPLPSYDKTGEHIEIAMGIRTKTPDAGFDGLDLTYRWKDKTYVTRLPVEFFYCPGNECPDS